MPFLFPQVGRFRHQGSVLPYAVRFASTVTIAWLAILASFPATSGAQGFAVWGPPLGVPPSFPYPFGVYPGHPMVGIPPAPFHTPFYGPHFPDGFSHALPPRGGFRDYRHEYNMRLADAYRAQMQIAAAYSANPMPQAEIERYLRSSAYPSGGDYRPGFGAAADMNAASDWPHRFGIGSFGPDPWPHERGDMIPQAKIPPGDVRLGQMTDSLRQSASRLDDALKRRGDDGQTWREYLRLETILAAVSHPDSAVSPDVAVELAEAVNHFDGIVAAGDLRHVMRSDGFAETRFWLKRLVDAVSAENAATGN